MKRRMLIGTIIATLLFSTVALAEGSIEVTDKTTFLIPGKKIGYFYAKIENTGDAPIGVDNGKLVVFSDKDDILSTSDYVSSYPSRILLNPGEYTYLKESMWDDALEGQTLGDVKFSIEGTDRSEEVESIPCEVTFALNGSYDNYAYVTFTNDSDETRYDYYIDIALFDEEGNLIYVDTTSHDSVGVHPGSTITVKNYVDSNNLEYFAANGITVSSADAVVYYKPDR